jgi:hypothetical protein
MRRVVLAMVSVATLAGCASTVSVSKLKGIQDTGGFYTKSLDYTGSSQRHHYFDQFVLFDMGFWIPGVDSDGYRGFKVPRSQLSLPTELEFDRKTYKGEGDERRRKIRIQGDPNFHVERRKTVGERLAETFPDGIDWSKPQVERAADGTYVLTFGS